MISDRKLEHLWLCRHFEVEYKHKKTGFEEIELIHKALPQINKKNININTEFFGKKLDAPIIISAITGGHPAALKINQELAKAADKLNIGMGVGSQRAAVENPELTNTYTVVRDEAPDAFVMGNIGASHAEYANKAAEMIDADAMAVHLNLLQEAIQPEGDVDASGYLSSIKKTSENLDVPLIVKETGAGISGEDATSLEKAGAAAIDVAGAGGTSWAAVETYRRQERFLGDLYWDWGIPTAVSTVEVCESVNIPVIASGGVRTGLDAAKALALGADAVGLALPLLKEAYHGHEAVIAKLENFIVELKVAMFLVGASQISDLKLCNLIIQGKTGEWLLKRGFETKKYSRRASQ